MATEQIPVEFEFEGKHYSGYFIEPHGAGSNVWFLFIDRYFMGQLICGEVSGWVFYNNKGLFNGLTEYFSDVVTAWYQ